MFQIKRTSILVEATVATGRSTLLDSKLAPQVIVRGVPSSVMLIHRYCAFVGVPDRFVVNDVIFVARAVIE